LFSASGHPITAKQAEEIRSSTGGWAIAINAIILTGSESSVKKIAKQHWETFIRNEVWDKWGDTVKTLMMKASISDKITPQLCDALTDRKDSAAILNQLVMENAFLSTDDGENFYFHHLFRQFLMHMLEQESQKTQNALYKKAGAYFYHKKEYYNAVRYYLKSDNSSGVSKSLKHMYDYNSPYAAIEDTLAIVKQSVDGSIIDKYPFLLEVQAWAAFVEGRAKDMEAILDRYYKLFPKIVLQNPPSVQTMFMLRCMDYRNNLIDIAKSVKMLPLKYLAKAGTPSLTNNQPFFHRSIRDFTEFLTDTDTNFALLKKTLGAVIGDEFDTIENGIRAGLHYEQGDMQKAHAYALEANAGIREHFSPEIKFCALVILAEIYYETKQTADLQKTLANITAMIERNRAYYLGANYQAYLCRRKLNDGDEAAAKKWLRDYPADTQKELSYFKLIQHFITARAYITAGDYGTAILFIKRLLALCEAYRRPIDIIESRILLAIAYWKKGRGFQGDALHVITDAIVSAYRYGYTQVFANEGAELVNMLHRLHLAAAVKDYSGVLPGAFAKTLYIMALSRSKITKGLTGGRLIKPLTFTEQQKAVMRLLCEGQSQQAAADKLGLKVTGIKSHLQLIYKKLDVSNGVDAVMKIKELGLL
jgi:LuxR family maltose regulon positive regulatory protein